MARLGRRQPFKPIINRQSFLAGAPPVGRITGVRAIDQARLRARLPARTQIVPLKATRITFVQSAGAGQTNSGTVQNLAFPNNVTKGDLLVVLADWAPTGTTVITDTIGNVWTSIAGPFLQPTFGTVTGQLFYTVSKASGPDTITSTVNVGGGNAFMGLAIAEYRCPSQYTFVLDSSNHNQGSLQTTLDTGTIPVNGPDELVVGTISQADTITYTPAPGWNLRVNQPTGTTQMSVFLQDRLSVFQSIDSSGTADHGTDFVGIGASFFLSLIPMQAHIIQVRPPDILYGRRQRLFRPTILRNPAAYARPPAPVGRLTQLFAGDNLRLGRKRLFKVTILRNPAPFSAGAKPIGKFLFIYAGDPARRGRRKPPDTFILGLIKVLPKRRPSANKTLIRRDPTLANDPGRRSLDILTTIINSLAGQGQLIQTGPAEWRIIGAGFVEQRPPTSNDDAAGGVVVGATWVDQSAGHVYINVVNTIGLAVWKLVV